MKVKIDANRRVFIPKTICTLMGIDINSEVDVEYDSFNKCIIISTEPLRDMKHMIKNRLKKDITKSERNFLIDLLEFTKIKGDEDDTIKK